MPTMFVRRKPKTRYDDSFGSARFKGTGVILGDARIRQGSTMKHECEKAWLRATRERIGLSQAGLASMSHVTVDMVKKWENPKYKVRVPKDVVETVGALLEEHKTVVSDALAAARGIRDGLPDEHPRIIYYRTQAEYEHYGRNEADGLPDAYQIVNARNRDLAAELERRGMEVEYSYPRNGMPKA
jgi:transcriptional regulator with XRE-family HTH domain